MGLVRYRVLVSGRVQGVYFRDSTRREALSQGLSGWVRNLKDGRVEAVFEGTSEGVEKLLEWCRHGPPAAHVEAVEAFKEEPERLTGFEIRGSG